MIKIARLGAALLAALSLSFTATVGLAEAPADDLLAVDQSTTADRLDDEGDSPKKSKKAKAKKEKKAKKDRKAKAAKKAKKKPEPPPVEDEGEDDYGDEEI
jgi:hypothetical protein